MKIKLIVPHAREGDDSMSGEAFKLQRLCLPVLAAHTPNEHEIVIVDESFGPDDSSEDVDLVGISVVSEMALRAYKIADEYSRKGAKVVMGGIHPTVLPREALQHSDSVVIGEGEYVWPRLVYDAAHGRLQPVYQSDRSVDLSNLPVPSREIYPRTRVRSSVPQAVTIESSRGCPYDCEFCTIGTTLGRRYRTRPVPELIREIESVESPYLFFVDDSLGLNREHAKHLFSKMISLGKSWIGQGNASLAADPELLRLMARAGCKGLLIGFESIQRDSQQDLKKITSLKMDYSEAMRRFHDEGIAILGAFVFGFDHDDKDVFDRTLDFVLESRMDAIQLRILTPFPGTRLYDRLLKEGRLITSEWWLKGFSSKTLLFQPRNMSMDQFIEGFTGLVRESYSFSSIFTRIFGVSPFKRGSIGIKLYLGYNLATRNRYLKNLKDPRPQSGINPYYSGLPI